MTMASDWNANATAICKAKNWPPTCIRPRSVGASMTSRAEAPAKMRLRRNHHTVLARLPSVCAPSVARISRYNGPLACRISGTATSATSALANCVMPIQWPCCEPSCAFCTRLAGMLTAISSANVLSAASTGGALAGEIRPATDTGDGPSASHAHHASSSSTPDASAQA